MPSSVWLGGAGCGSLQRHACADLLIDEEQQARLLRYGHLRVIARRLKLAVPLQQRGVKLVGAFDAGAQNWCTQAVKFAATRVEHQQALRGKDS